MNFLQCLKKRIFINKICKYQISHSRGCALISRNTFGKWSPSGAMELPQEKWEPNRYLGKKVSCVKNDYQK